MEDHIEKKFGEEIDKKFGEGTLEKLKEKKLEERVLNQIRDYHNPENLPVGHYTGRCMYCHSDDLWSDVTFYGCEVCDTIYGVGDLPPMLAPNAGHTLSPEQEAYNNFVDELYGPKSRLKKN